MKLINSNYNACCSFTRNKNAKPVEIQAQVEVFSDIKEKPAIERYFLEMI